MDNKEIEKYSKSLSRCMTIIGMVGLLVDAFGKFSEDAKVHTAKELEKAIKKLEENE